MQTAAVALAGFLLWLRERAQAALRSKKQKRDVRLWALLSALAAASAVTLHLWALELTYVGVVEALKRAIDIILALILGATVFKEHLSRTHIFLVALLALGLVAVVAPP